MEDFYDSFPLRAGRAHEAVGPAAASLAAIACGLRTGPALWAVEGWRGERLNPAGFARFCEPGRVLLALGQDHTDILALAEEALRSGAVATVVAELTKPLDLTAGRRLQLAAEAGGALGILLIGDDMGSNAAETRWRCTPLFDPDDSTLQHWELIKNKSGTLAAWKVRWDDAAHSVTVVRETGERARLARAAV